MYNIILTYYPVLYWKREERIYKNFITFWDNQIKLVGFAKINSYNWNTVKQLYSSVRHFCDVDNFNPIVSNIIRIELVL